MYAVHSHTSLMLPILHSHSSVNNLENDDDDSNSYLPNYVNVAILLLTKKDFLKTRTFHPRREVILVTEADIYALVIPRAGSM